MVSATPRNILSVCNSDCLWIVTAQRAKTVVSDRPGLVAFAIILSEGLWEIHLQMNFDQSC